MTEEPGSAVRHGGRGLAAALQVTNHGVRQQETSELKRGASGFNNGKRAHGSFCGSPQDGSKIHLCVSELSAKGQSCKDQLLVPGV